MIFAQNKEGKEKEEMFPANVSDVNFVGRGHKTLRYLSNSGLLEFGTKRGVGVRPTQDHDPAKSVLPPYWILRAWPEPLSHHWSQPEDTAA